MPDISSLLKRDGPQVAPKSVQVGATLHHLGVKLGQVGPSWAEIGPSAAVVSAVSDRNSVEPIGNTFTLPKFHPLFGGLLLWKILPAV